jgi:hypothetical protein
MPVTRDQLYEEVWAEPMVYAAALDLIHFRQSW